MKIKIPIDKRFKFYQLRYQVRQKLLKILFVSSLVFLAKEYFFASETLVFENPTLTTAVAIAASSEVIETSPVRSDPNDPAVVIEGDIEKKIAAAFPGEERLAIAIAKCESRLDPTRVGDTDFYQPSIGLFQINQHFHPYGTEYLKNPDNNIQVAKEIRQRWGNWDAWSCYKYGFYEKHL